MKKASILFLLTVYCISNMAAQGREDYCHVKLVIDSQIRYYRNLPVRDTGLYVSLINVAPVIRPRVIGEIERIDPSATLCQSRYFNICEGYDINSGDICGLIWVDSIYYSYLHGDRTGLGGSNASRVTKKTYAELDEIEKDIVSHFSDWENKIFSSKNRSLHFIIHSSYYLASRARFDGQNRIETIAFCY